MEAGCGDERKPFQSSKPQTEIDRQSTDVEDLVESHSVYLSSQFCWTVFACFSSFVNSHPLPLTKKVSGNEINPHTGDWLS